MLCTLMREEWLFQNCPSGLPEPRRFWRPTKDKTSRFLRNCAAVSRRRIARITKPEDCLKTAFAGNTRAPLARKITKDAASAEGLLSPRVNYRLGLPVAGIPNHDFFG